MKRLLIILVAVLIVPVILSAQTVPQNSKTLFERLGGTAGITTIVDDIIEAHMNNKAINSRFKYLLDQPERLAKIREHTIEFISAGSGGQVEYTGRDMQTVHKNMDISAEEFLYVIDDIMGVLEKHKIDDESKKDVLAILWSLKGTIMTKPETNYK